MSNKTIHKAESGYVLKSLPSGMSRPQNGDCVVMSAEIVDRGGDIVRVKGMDVQPGTVVLAQHMHRAPDGSPTVIGKIDQVMDHKITHNGQRVNAKVCSFIWADTELAMKYKQLWPEFINKVSIGARVLEEEPLDAKNPYKGYDYKKTEVFELSVVTIPANPAAGVLRTIQQALGDSLDEMTVLKSELYQQVNEQFQKLHDRFDRFEEDFVAMSQAKNSATGDRKSLSADDVKKLSDALESVKAHLS